jgi:tetratricopeptide (TPR) repeat protein
VIGIIGGDRQWLSAARQVLNEDLPLAVHACRECHRPPVWRERGCLFQAGEIAQPPLLRDAGRGIGPPDDPVDGRANGDQQDRRQTEDPPSDGAARVRARARALDPVDPMMHAMSTQVAYQARDYAAVLEHWRQAREIDPEFSLGGGQVAAAYYQLGRTGMALEALPKTNLAFRGYLLAKQGRAGEAREILRTLESLARDQYVQPSQLAMVHAGLGEREAVFHWLDKAYAVHDVHLMFLPVDPRWDEYRPDPRFEALMARCGFTRN